MRRCLILSVGQRIRLEPRLDPHCSELLGLIDCMPEYEFVAMSAPFANEDAVPMCGHPRAYLHRNEEGRLDWDSLFAHGDLFDAILVPSQCHINDELLQGIEYASKAGLELFFLLGDPRPAYWQWSLQWQFSYIIASTASKAQAESVLSRACMQLPWELEAGKYVLRGRAAYKTHLRGYAGFQEPDEFRLKLMLKYNCLGIGPTEPVYRSITGNLRIDNGQELADYKSRFRSLLFLIGQCHMLFGGYLNVRIFDGVANKAELHVPEELSFLFTKQLLSELNGAIVKS